MNIQWYPGHMTKAVRSMRDDIKLIDLVIELVDARVPLSSRNPDIDNICGSKPRLLILGKCDLADEAASKMWKSYFEEKGLYTIFTDSRKSNLKSEIENKIKTALNEKIQRDRKRGILNRPLRVMIAGIPNVGKSTLINTLAKKSAAKTGDKPGVTKGNQWIKAYKGIEMLDTPGLLWPKFEDENVGIKLALLGSINENIIDLEQLATYGIKFMVDSYKGALSQKYGVTEDAAPYEILEDIANKKNLIKSGQKADTLRAAKLFLDDLRSSRLGKITLELP